MKTLLVASVFVSSVAAAAEPIECVATINRVSHYVSLWEANGISHMSVYSDAGERASGRATMYRANTRYFLPTGPGTGYKLNTDGTRSLCLGAEGTNCHSCVPNNPQSWIRRTRCSVGATMLEVRFRGADNAAEGNFAVTTTPEMAVYINGTITVAGPALKEESPTEARYVLRVGQGELERYILDTDAHTVTLAPGTQPRACTLTTETRVGLAKEDVLESVCRVYEPGNATWWDAKLYSREGNHYLGLMMGGDPSGFTWTGTAGAAIAFAHNEWRTRDIIYTDNGSTGEICTADTGCRPCVIQ